MLALSPQDFLERRLQTLVFKQVRGSMTQHAPAQHGTGWSTLPQHGTVFQFAACYCTAHLHHRQYSAAQCAAGLQYFASQLRLGETVPPGVMHRSLHTSLVTLYWMPHVAWYTLMLKMTSSYCFFSRVWPRASTTLVC